MINKLKSLPKKFLITGGAIIFIALFGTTFFVNTYANRREVKTYDYDEVEQALADEVKAYLGQYMALPEQISNDIADVAVQNYNIVMESDTDVITDEITDAVTNRMRSTIFALADDPENLSDDTLDGLSAGITEIIWNTILSQISQRPITSAEYEAEYDYLVQSLQGQIDNLKERKTKVSINANIIDKTQIDVLIDDLSDEELKALAERLGLNDGEDLTQDQLNAAASKINKELQDEINDLRKELKKEISKTAAKPGATGKPGAKGEKGATGQSGTSGKTTYIAYADDTTGKNFSLTPTETSKYVGTCISSDTQQPRDASKYSNWQAYRAYVITATTDDAGVTTVHIN